MGKLTISMAIFNSYFDITRGYIELAQISFEIPIYQGHAQRWLWRREVTWLIQDAAVQKF